MLPVSQVRGEKEVLHHYIDFAETGLACIEAGSEAQAKQLCRNKHDHIADYCIYALGFLRVTAA